MKKQLIFLIIVTFWRVQISAAPGDVRYLNFENKENISSHSLKNDPSVDYYTIQQIKVTELEVEKKGQPFLLVDPDDDPYPPDGHLPLPPWYGGGGLGRVIMSVGQLLALGTRILHIVKQGQPVFNMQEAPPLSVFPNTEKKGDIFSEMAHWSAPHSKKYRVEYTNRLGKKVVSFIYNLQFQCCGQHKEKGRYLTGLKISASEVKVSWGFRLNASSELVAISNRGSQENPVAGATLELKYRVSNILRQNFSGESFHVTGEGVVERY